MGLIDIFKKITRKNKIKERGTEEKVAFTDVEKWIENKRSEIKNKEKEILVLIKSKTTIVIKELNEKLRALESVDIESKKVEEKIKLIVKENLNNYISHVREFIGCLNNFEEGELNKIIYKIDNIFSDFDKKSYVNYQKATFLIGKEMAAVKESTIALSKYFKDLFNKNRDIVELSKILSSLKLDLKQIEELDQITGRTNERIKKLDSKIIILKEEIEKRLEEIEKTKKSEDYVENLKKREKINSLKEELEKEISKLRETIDFKALGNFFHINQEEMNTIKIHKENFQTEFQKDDGATILRFLNESKLNNETIDSKIKKINDEKQEINQIKETIKKDATESISAEIKERNLEIERLNTEKQKELKTNDKLKTKKQEAINSIKEKLSELNVLISED